MPHHPKDIPADHTCREDHALKTEIPACLSEITERKAWNTQQMNSRSIPGSINPTNRRPPPAAAGPTRRFPLGIRLFWG